MMPEQVVAVPADIGGAHITLQTTIYKPSGAGPFPVLFMNHGKSGGDAHLQPRATFPVISREFVKRGYAVVIPMRMGLDQTATRDFGAAFCGKSCANSSFTAAPTRAISASVKL